MDPSANFGKRRTAEPSAPVAAYTPEPLVLPRAVPAASGSSFLFPALGIFALLAVVFTTGLIYLAPATSAPVTSANIEAAPNTVQTALSQSDLIPANVLPDSIEEGAARSSEFVTRYPRDPRAHMLHAIHFLHQHDLADAEEQIRTAMAEGPNYPGGFPTELRQDLNLTLAIILLPQGRAQEAKEIAGKDCGYAANSALMSEAYGLLKAYKVCT
jgi:hypothetical protein